MKTRSSSAEDANSHLDSSSQVKQLSSDIPLQKSTVKWKTRVRINPSNLVTPQFNWQKPNTLLFLSFCTKYKKLFKYSDMKKKIIWEKIANDMLLNGYKLNGIQVENKWKNLLKNYKKYKSKKNRYFEYLDHVENLIQDIRPNFTDESSVKMKIENSSFSNSDFWLKYYKECHRRRQERIQFQLQVIRQNQDLLQKLTDAISENEKVILQRYNTTVNNPNEVKVDKRWINGMSMSLTKCDENVHRSHTKKLSTSLKKVNEEIEKNFNDISRLTADSDSLKTVICLPTNTIIKEELNINSFQEDGLDFVNKNQDNIDKINFTNETNLNNHCSYGSSRRVINNNHVLPIVKPCDLYTYSTLPNINQAPLLDLPVFSKIKDDFNTSSIAVVKEELCDSDDGLNLNNNSCIKFKCDLSTVKVELYEEPSSEENYNNVQSLSTNSSVLCEQNHEQLDVKPFLTSGAMGETSDLNLEEKEHINVLLNISGKRRQQCETINQKMTDMSQNLHKQFETRINFTDYGDYTEASSSKSDNDSNNYSINFYHPVNQEVSSFKKINRTKPFLYSNHPLWLKAYFKMTEKRREERDNARKKIQQQSLNITEKIASLISTTMQQPS